MAQSIHLICRRVHGGGLKGVTKLEPAPRFRSVSWELSAANAAALVGGWVYFHPSKTVPSEMGGRIIAVEESGERTAHDAPEVAIIFEAAVEGRGQKWRGMGHSMAWTGGNVEADLPHERPASQSA